jgi:hypothetical protein
MSKIISRKRRRHFRFDTSCEQMVKISLSHFMHLLSINSFGRPRISNLNQRELLKMGCLLN